MNPGVPARSLAAERTSLRPLTTVSGKVAHDYSGRSDKHCEVPAYFPQVRFSVIVSAYTPRGYISNRTYDFGSIADARAGTDLSDFFQGSFRFLHEL
jgi:hypothetical protein